MAVIELNIWGPEELEKKPETPKEPNVTPRPTPSRNTRLRKQVISITGEIVDEPT